jgi:hypothetical protein
MTSGTTEGRPSGARQITDSHQERDRKALEQRLAKNPFRFLLSFAGLEVTFDPHQAEGRYR